MRCTRGEEVEVEVATTVGTVGVYTLSTSIFSGAVAPASVTLTCHVRRHAIANVSLVLRNSRPGFVWAFEFALIFRL